MAYYYDPNSYVNTLYGGPPPFVRRRPSPPPATYYPREAQDPYLRALAEEQAARAALQDAIKREREARQRRAEEEAKTQISEHMRERERLRQRPQSMYPYVPSYGYPDYSGYSEVGYPQLGYVPASYGDMDIDYEDEYPQYTPYFAPYARPSREPVRKQPQFQSVPRKARSQPCQPRQPVYKNKRQPGPEQPSPVDTAPKIHIPISSPSDKPRRLEASNEEKEAAASKIQFAYRIHHAQNEIKAAREQFSQLISSFVFPATLEFDLSSPPRGDERPKLMYNKNNAPVHAHEDALVRLLQKLDAIESRGERDVRERRRELVKEVEGELERVDKEVRGQYEQVKEKIQPAESKKEDKMHVEPGQPSTERPTQATEGMDEDTQASMRPSDEADAIGAHQIGSQTELQAMDVEPPRVDTSVSIYSTAPSSATVEDPPVGAMNDSPTEAEVETPLQVPVSLLRTVIQDADSSPQPTHPQADRPADIEMRKKSQGSVPSENLRERVPDQAFAVGQQKTHRVMIEDADDRNDSEEIVIVEARPESSSVVTEKEFVVV